MLFFPHVAVGWSSTRLCNSFLHLDRLCNQTDNIKSTANLLLARTSRRDALLQNTNCESAATCEAVTVVSPKPIIIKDY